MAQQGEIQKDIKIQTKGEKPTGTVVFREFNGINTQSPRESISDQQFSWLENAIPIGSGNLPLLTAANPPIGNYSTENSGYPVQPPIYQATANFNGNDWMFVVVVTGTMYAMNVQSGFVTTVGTGFNPGVQLTQWSDAGVVIIDPLAGYFDYNITAPNTLTQLAGGSPGTVAKVTLTAGGSGYSSLPTVVFSGGGGTGATGVATVGSGGTATVVYGSGGTRHGTDTPSYGYTVGEIITLRGGSFTTPMTLKVTATGLVGGLSGAIISVVINSPGSYSSFPSNPVGGSPVDLNGGPPTFNIGNQSVTGVTLTNPGIEYTSAPAVSFTGGGGVGAAGTAVLGGSPGAQVGTAIATYAGRVWIASARTVSYTDVASYNSFAGAGGAFTITDNTLHKNINALYSSNGYLYIFGDDSIDILSNVQVSSGATTFSRTNLTTSVGTTQPNSIFSYLRALVFSTLDGFYILSGSTPTKISDALDGLILNIDQSRPIYGFPAHINGILCAAFSFYLTDTFTTTYYGTVRPVFAFFFQGKWFIGSQGFSSASATSVPVQGAFNIFVADVAGGLYECFSSFVQPVTAIIATKLWDDGQPILDKQGLKAGIAAIYYEQTSLSATMDNEYGTTPLNLSFSAGQFVTWQNDAMVTVEWQNNQLEMVSWLNSQISQARYQFIKTSADQASGKYLGLTVTIEAIATIQALMLEYKTGNRW